MRPRSASGSPRYWVRFEVRNETDAALPWLLELAYPHLDYVDLYLPRAQGGFEVRRTGDHLPFAQRDLEYRNFVFELEEPRTAAASTTCD